MMMRKLFGLLILLCSITVTPGTASALYRGTEYGDMDISGRLRTTNIVRHRNLDKLAFIMQRNELRLRFEWKWLQRGKAFKRFKNSWLDRMRVSFVRAAIRMVKGEGGDFGRAGRFLFEEDRNDPARE